MSILHKELKSFGAAIKGLVHFFMTERHAMFHFIAMVTVIAAGCYFNISEWQWVAVIVAFGLVIGAEMLNTAIEKLCDMVEPEHHPRIAIIKDISAGAVLFTALMAVAIALIIFIPYCI